jgi:hypothetical protein
MGFISTDENKEDYFITHNHKYIIKTISRKEHKIFFKYMLKPYHQRVIEGSSYRESMDYSNLPTTENT